MFVMTMTKRKLLRVIMFILVLITGIAIGVFAILSSIDTKAAGTKLPIYCVGRNDNKISLTFDCAWANSNTDQLIAILAQENVKATFFVTGEFCDKYPEDIKKLYEAGHEIQNHSDAHPHVNGMNINDLIEDTKECSRKIKMITGEEPMLYRAPYGEYCDTVITTVEGMGLSVIQWNIDSIDWDKPSPETIIERTTKNIPSGSILLFHNDLENTTEALPKVIASLKEQGFEFCKVSELIYTENFEIDATGKQMPKGKATIIYSENDTVNAAFAALAQNLSISDVEQLAAEGMSPAMAEKTSSILTAEQIAALQTQSYEELKESFAKLKTAVYARAAEAPADTTTESYNDEPIVAESTLPSESTAPAPETTTVDKDGNPPPQTEATSATTPATSFSEDKDAGIPSDTETTKTEITSAPASVTAGEESPAPTEE